MERLVHTNLTYSGLGISGHTSTSPLFSLALMSLSRSISFTRMRMQYFTRPFLDSRITNTLYLESSSFSHFLGQAISLRSGITTGFNYHAYTERVGFAATQNSVLRMAVCNFTEIDCQGSNGALCTTDVSVHAFSCRWTDCTNAKYGGGLFAKADNIELDLTVEMQQGTFQDCSAEYGGGFASMSISHVRHRMVNFIENRAVKQGGCMYIRGKRGSQEQHLTVRNCLFYLQEYNQQESAAISAGDLTEFAIMECRFDAQENSTIAGRNTWIVSTDDEVNWDGNKWNNPLTDMWEAPTASFTPSPNFTQTATFTQSFVFSCTEELSYSDMFSQSEDFPASNSFSSSPSWWVTPPSKHFTHTQAFSQTSEFTNTEQFTESIMTNSRQFTVSHAFSQTSVFTASSCFAPTKTFTPVPTPLPTRSPARSSPPSATFTASSPFTASATFAPRATPAPTPRVLQWSALGLTMLIIGILVFLVGLFVNCMLMCQQIATGEIIVTQQL